MVSWTLWLGDRWGLYFVSVDFHTNPVRETPFQPVFQKRKLKLPVSDSSQRKRWISAPGQWVRADLRRCTRCLSVETTPVLFWGGFLRFGVCLVVRKSLTLDDWKIVLWHQRGCHKKAPLPKVKSCCQTSEVFWVKTLVPCFWLRSRNFTNSIAEATHCWVFSSVKTVASGARRVTAGSSGTFPQQHSILLSSIPGP